MGIRSIIYPLLFSTSLLLSGCAGVTGESVKTGQLSDSATEQMDHKTDFFAARKGLRDGYEIIFHIMPAPEGAGFSRKDYHLMVGILQDSKPLTNLTVYSDMKYPDGSFEPRLAMMRMGEWYMTHYNLSHEPGQYLITIAFDVSGKHYNSSIHYPEFAIPSP
ncbi:MAG: hypothetical protein Q9M31_08940 [Mariprofundus sp.]|nr:hypothetical protein [Mariprofundus sp.]